MLQSQYGVSMLGAGVVSCGVGAHGVWLPEADKGEIGKTYVTRGSTEGKEFRVLSPIAMAMAMAMATASAPWRALLPSYRWLALSVTTRFNL